MDADAVANEGGTVAGDSEPNKQPNMQGLYWDDHRNRYFPLSSRPPIVQKHTEDPPPPKRPKRISNAAHNQARHRAAHDVLGSHYSNTSRCTISTIPSVGRIKAFRATFLEGEPRRFIGDDQGWVYAASTTSAGQRTWITDLILEPRSQISSICISGNKYVATSSSKVSVQDLNAVGRTQLLSLSNVHDIWTSHLHDTSLVLGAHNKAAYLPDIDHSPLVRILDTQSDVFAVTQQDDLIYTGCRNGSVIRFDKRMVNQRQNLPVGVPRNQQRTSVLHLELLADWQLLVSYMNGDLMTFDLRYSRPSAPPLTRYLGHTNTFTQKLGIAFDPNQEFLFAAGQDRRIRGWSVGTGTPLFPSSRKNSEDDQRNPFLHEFPSIVETMQVLVEDEGISLWAACDRNLYQFHLGQRYGEGFVYADSCSTRD